MKELKMYEPDEDGTPKKIDELSTAIGFGIGIVISIIIIIIAFMVISIVR